MSDSRNKRFRLPVAGRAEMQALTDRVMTALESTGLTPEMQLLHQQVFTRSTETLFDSGVDTQWTFKPMVELLLVHVLNAVTNGRSLQERQQDIRWAIAMAGF